MMKPESRLQDKVCKYLKDERIYYINTHGSGWSAKGAPDIIVCLDGRFLAFELKVGKNRLQDDQKIHKERIERSGGRFFSPYTLEEFIKIIQNGGDPD